MVTPRSTSRDQVEGRLSGSQMPVKQWRGFSILAEYPLLVSVPQIKTIMGQ